MQYDPSKSPFVNLFDIRYADPAEHFIRLATLLYLARVPSDGPTGGYIKLSDLMAYLSTFGYTHNIANTDIAILLEKQCIRKGIDADNLLISEDSVRITSLGKYHLYSLASRFQYLDAVLIDTPILDNELARLIKNVHTISERLIRTRIFLEYLDKVSAHIRDDEVRNCWAGISAKAKKKYWKFERTIKYERARFSEVLCADVLQLRAEPVTVSAQFEVNTPCLLRPRYNIPIPLYKRILPTMR